MPYRDRIRHIFCENVLHKTYLVKFKLENYLEKKNSGK